MFPSIPETAPKSRCSALDPRRTRTFTRTVRRPWAARLGGFCTVQESAFITIKDLYFGLQVLMTDRNRFFQHRYCPRLRVSTFLGSTPLPYRNHRPDLRLSHPPGTDETPPTSARNTFDASNIVHIRHITPPYLVAAAYHGSDASSSHRRLRRSRRV